FNDAANALYHFVWHEFCDWYLEFAKPILGGADAGAARETRAAAAWALDRLLHLLHPFMPFVTEELWAATGGTGPLISADWPVFDAGLVDEAAAAELDWAIRLISAVRAVRSEMNVPAAARVPLRLRDANATTLARLAAHRDQITLLARLDSIETGAAATPQGAVQIVVDEATVVLPLAGVIDVAQEKARLAKEVAKTTDDIARIEKKLANAQFVAKAPPEVVEEQRQRMADAEQARARLATALERLAGA
ncbi:MAG: class I tRNA ligase family protein, partial [Dongiaceae bacterium]